MFHASPARPRIRHNASRQNSHNICAIAITINNKVLGPCFLVEAARCSLREIVDRCLNQESGP